MNYNIYCCQQSGQNFPTQIALLSDLTLAKEKVFELTGIDDRHVNLGLGTSGGNVALTLLNISSLNNDKFLDISSKLNSVHFARKWCPPMLQIYPNIVNSLFAGSLYKSGYGGSKLFEDISSQRDKEKEFEMWTGTYDYSSAKSQFFCNKGRDKSCINQYYFDIEHNNQNPLVYTNDNDEMLFLLALSSSSIPFVIPPKTINGRKYGDGAIMFSSPLSTFCNEIYRHVSLHNYVDNDSGLKDEDNNFEIVIGEEQEQPVQEKQLRLYYVQGKNADNYGKNLNPFSFIESAIEASSINDKNSAISLLKLLCDSIIKEVHHKIHLEDLVKHLIRCSVYKHYIFVLKPIVNTFCDIELVSFSGSDILRNVKKIKEEGYTLEIFRST